MIFAQINDTMKQAVLTFWPTEGNVLVIEDVTISPGEDQTEKLERVMMRLIGKRNEQWFQIKLTAKTMQYKAAFEALGFGFFMNLGKAHRSELAYNILTHARA